MKISTTKMRLLMFALAALLCAGSANGVQAADTKVVTPAELTSLFVKRGLPQYPYEARRAYQSGTGLFRMYVEPDGQVRTVAVMKSTGSKILDLAAAGGLYQWRAKPYPKRREIDMPVRFSMAPGVRQRAQ